MAQTITDALTTCGVLVNTTGIFVNGKNGAEMISGDVFNENFNTCVNIKFSKIEDNWKTYSGPTVAEGGIRLRPRTKVNIRAFVQWERRKIGQYYYPSLTLFPLAERDDLIKGFNTHKQWLEYAANLAHKYIPNNFH